MASVFNMYPVLTQELTEKISVKADGFEFSYNEDCEIFPLEMDEVNGKDNSFSARLKDPRCVWYPESNNLIVRKSGIIDVAA